MGRTTPRQPHGPVKATKKGSGEKRRWPSGQSPRHCQVVPCELRWPAYRAPRTAITLEAFPYPPSNFSTASITTS